MSSNLGEQVNPFDRRRVVGAVGLRHAPQFHRQLQLRAAVRAAVRSRSNRLTDGLGAVRARRGSAAAFRSRSTTPPTRRCSARSATASTTTCSTRRTTRRAATCRSITIRRRAPAFNTACFSLPALGQLGNAPRRFFYGPGIENIDLALLKNVPFGRRAAPRSSVSRRSTSSITRSSTAPAPWTATSQPDVRPDRRGGRAALHPARRQVLVLSRG